ncbi:MAG: cofactor-independent phosphoglycerate mutase [Chloroflexi bacterium RBG_13_60_13]|nr:MAG: cofactor-independent phosphoglycerate mutase [Chloroflexi bacterium RBG_13_60_13]
MRYAVLVGDGMADYPLEELGDRTPLEVARIPNMDEIARQGHLGSVRTIPPGMPPGSDVATLSILGYDPRRHYTGRGPLEAAKLGVEISPQEVAFRCNLVTVDDGRLVDYSSGHISSAEASDLIGFLQRELGTESVRFHPGVSYRHICVIKDLALMHVGCTPPHDVIGQPIEKNIPAGREAELLRDLMIRSHRLLDGHEVNRARVRRGEKAANMIWLWGQGGTPQIPSFKERFGIGGGVISAVDLVKGIACLIGLDSIEVPGATGYYDTDYAAKGSYAVKCLDREEFILVHVEAPDEAGHNGDLDQKIKAIESFDQHVVGPVMRQFGGQPGFRALVLPDHPTPIHLRTHTAEPVPFAWYGPGLSKGGASAFSEREADVSDLIVEHGYQLMERFIAGEK